MMINHSMMASSPNITGKAQDETFARTVATICCHARSQIARGAEHHPDAEGFLLNPAGTLGQVFPARPLPKTSEDGAICLAKGTATHHVPVIVGTAYFRVEE